MAKGSNPEDDDELVAAVVPVAGGGCGCLSEELTEGNEANPPLLLPFEEEVVLKAPKGSNEMLF